MDMIILESIISSKYEIFESTEEKEKTITYAVPEVKSDFMSEERQKKNYLKTKEKTMFIFLFAACVALWFGFILLYIMTKVLII